MSEYNISNIDHILGKSNTVADALSRHVPDSVDQLLDEIPSLSCVTRQEDEDLVEWDVNILGEKQDQVPLYKNIKQYLTGKKSELPRFLAAPVNQFEL